MANQTSVSNLTHISPQFLVYARHTSAASPTINKLIGLSGIVRHSNESNEEGRLENGASVGCLLPASEYDPSQQFPQTWAVKNNLIFKKPPALPLVQAAALPRLFIRAFASVCEILEISPQNLIDELSSGLQNPPGEFPDPTTAILVVGGETPVGSAIIQLLGIARSSIFLFSTVAPMQGMEADEEALSAIAIEQVVMGCRYTIEQGAEDLIDHMRGGLEYGADGVAMDEVDVIVDAAGDLGSRAEIIVSAFSSDRTRVVRANDLSASAPLAPQGDVGTGAVGQDDALDTGDGDQMLPLLAKLVDGGRFKLPDHLHITVHSREDFLEADVQGTSSGLALVAIDVGSAQ